MNTISEQETRRDLELLHDEYQRRADDDALPPHKREGYAEMMYELADMIRDMEKGN